MTKYDDHRTRADGGEAGLLFPVIISIDHEREKVAHMPIFRCCIVSFLSIFAWLMAWKNISGIQVFSNSMEQSGLSGGEWPRRHVKPGSVAIKRLSADSPVTFVSWSVTAFSDLIPPLYEKDFSPYNAHLTELFASAPASSTSTGLLKLYGVVLDAHGAPPRIPTNQRGHVLSARCTLTLPHEVFAPLACKVFSNTGLWSETLVILYENEVVDPIQFDISFPCARKTTRRPWR